MGCGASASIAPDPDDAVMAKPKARLSEGTKVPTSANVASSSSGQQSANQQISKRQPLRRINQDDDDPEDLEAEARQIRQSIMHFGTEGGDGESNDLTSPLAPSSKRSTLLLDRRAQQSNSQASFILPADDGDATTHTNTGLSNRGSLRMSSRPNGSSRSSHRLTINSPFVNANSSLDDANYNRDSVTSPTSPQSTRQSNRRRTTRVDFSRMTIEQISELTPSEIGDLWVQLDSDKNGVLDKRELRALAIQLSEAVYRHVEKNIKAQMPHLSEKSLHTTVEKEMKFLLPIRSSSENATRDLSRYLQNKLDIDGDGMCSRLEFQARWGSITKEILRLSHENASGHETVGCVII